MKSPYAVYKRVKMETTTPQEAVFLAYDGIVKYIKSAIDYMNEKKYELATEAIFKARRLFSELTLGLNDECKSLADHFRAIYNYCYYLTVKANLEKDASLLEEVMHLVVPLRDAWNEAKHKMACADKEGQSSIATVSQ